MIRPFTPEDCKALCDMMEAEGIGKDGMAFLEQPTFVYDDGEIKGFYTYEIQHSVFPYLEHFCVRRDSRSSRIARELIKDFRQKMKKVGFHKFIIHTLPSTEKIIKWYFKVKEPYATLNGLNYYLAEV